MSTVEVSRSSVTKDHSKIELVDCDVHCTINSIEDLMPYLPDVWQHYVRESGFRAPPPSRYPRVKRNSARDDSHPPSGRVPGSDLAFLQRQHFDHWLIDRAIMNPLYGVDCLPNPDFSAALCSAHNDYIIQEWYERDERMRGSIIVPWRDPELAVREIERVGGHPRVVQILLPMCAGALYGQRQFHPIWEAACRHNLVVAIHFGGNEPPRASGAAPSFYLEYHVNLAQAAMAHIVSLVCEGAFERFPSMRVVIIEGGTAWLPSLMWRLDRDWRGCRMEVPWVRRAPSEYIRDHVRLTTQPIEEPDNPMHLLQTIEHMGSDRMLMFSTDYPHWDFDSPSRALPTIIPKALRQRIMSENAIEFYKLS
jgi:uncharacterized protein